MTIHESQIEFIETGAGQTVLFVPGSFSTSAAWRGVQRDLQTSHHCVSTSLRGYGTTLETRNLDDYDIDHQVQLVRSIVGRIGAPVHLVGHSYGATVALATALDGNIDLRSITTFEANPISLLSHLGAEKLVAEARQLTADLEKAYFDGDPDAAGLVIDYWGGKGVFASMPETVREYCRATICTNILDWRSAGTLSAGPETYSKLDVPVLLVRGELANPIMVAITDALGAHLPNVRTAVVEGAGHFLISTHARECGDLLAGFLDKITNQLQVPVAA